MPETHCLLCGGSDLTRVLEQTGVPVQSCVLLEDPEVAAAYPTGSIRLDACGGCGFVQNSAFDPGLVDYSQPYEETQSCSPTFRAFSDDLVARLAPTLRPDSRVLEIGCGKGDFLASLCAASGSTGLGIDPAYDPARRPEAATDRVTYRREFFPHGDPVEQADLVVCRHTLEHIPDVHDFASLLAGSMGPEGRLFVEVPDTDRIIDRGAFEDIYYEHCSYFTAHSLGQLLAAVGLRPHDVRLEYGGQYLTAMGARDGPPPPLRPPGGDGSGLAARISEAVAVARGHLSGAARPVVWGAGSKAVALLAAVGPEVAATVTATDINPVKWGTYLPGSARPVVAPRDLAVSRPDLVVVANPLYLDEVARDLDRMGLKPTLVALSA